MMTLHVVLAGGGTAGHIEPALNLADALRRHDPTIGITALGTERGLECTLVPARGYDLALIPAVPMPRKPNADLLALPARVRASVRAATEVLDRTEADVLVGFGGYVSLPGYLAARRRHIPLVVHEANAKAGLANRLAARLTPFVAETATGSLPHAESIGLPLRPSIVTLDRAERRAEAAEYFGLDSGCPTLLVFGGSQGARSLNAAVTAAVPDLTRAGIQVLHSVGARNDIVTSDDPGYRAVHYIDRMDLAYAVADLAVCRAGAMTVGELSAVGLPAVYVPLPIGNGEQRLNAEPVVAAGGGLLVDDAEFTPDWIRGHVIPMLTDPQHLARAAAAAASLGRRDADERLCDMVMRAVASTHNQRKEQS